MSQQASVENRERVVDVREISPSIRHNVLFQLFEHLDDTSSLQLIVDHDPRRLRINTANACDGRISNRAPTFGVSDSGLALQNCQAERVMSHQENNLLAMGIFDQVMVADNHERAYLESLIRSERDSKI